MFGQGSALWTGLWGIWRGLCGQPGTHLLCLAGMVCGAACVLYGMTRSIYRKSPYRNTNRSARPRKSFWLGLCGRLTSHPPLRLLRQPILEGLPFRLDDERRRVETAGAVTVATVCAGCVLALLLRKTGQLWYVKALVAVMCLVLPHYIATLGLDLYRYRMNRHVPRMIDEFRSAFIRTGRVKPALDECGKKLGKGLGTIVLRASDSTDINAGLARLRDSIGNVWFSMFVVLLQNFKENGGELVEQLYGLNRTMTRYMAIEKKKNRRLIWYEMFAVFASVFSIPAVLWLNYSILGGDAGGLADVGSNMTISRIVGFSIGSLLTVRFLRKF